MCSIGVDMCSIIVDSVSIWCELLQNQKKKKTSLWTAKPDPCPQPPKLSNDEGCIKVAAFIIGELGNLDDKKKQLDNKNKYIYISILFSYEVPMVFL